MWREVNHRSLKPTTTIELGNTSKTLASGKAPSYDKNSKTCNQKHFSLNFVTFNGYYETVTPKRHFPRQTEIAKVIPVYKMEDPCLIANYRTLRNFLREFNRLKEFVQKYDTLYCCQFGFRFSGKPIFFSSILLTEFHLQLIGMRPLQGFF